MLQFDHSKADIWTAMGYDAAVTHDFISKMTDFSKLYFTNDRFRNSFSKTPNSYQIQFILNDVLVIDQDNSAHMFLAGHLIGAFFYMQKDLERATLSEDVKSYVKDTLDKMKDDSDDF